MKRITIKELAERLGLSPSTVSRALAGDRNIRRETRERVSRLAGELGYRPNPVAVNLRSGRSNTVGVIVPEMVTPFAATVIGGIQRVLYGRGLKVIIAQSDENPQTECGNLELTPENFTRVANARTFGFFKDVEYLHSHGLARGGSLESVVVLDDNGVMNPEGLRYKDEFVRHKVLDFIGDMAMLGMPIQGQFEICCSGHQLNNAFLRKAESERALQLIDLSLEEAQNRKTREKRPAYEGSLALA